MESIVTTALAWLLTYAIHSSALLGIAWLLARWGRLSIGTMDFVWKLALVGGLLTTPVQMALHVSPSGSFALLTPSRTTLGAVSVESEHKNAERREHFVAEAQALMPTGIATPAVAGMSASSPASSKAPSASPLASLLASFSSRTIASALVGMWALVALTLVLMYVARRLLLAGRLANRQQVTTGALPDMLATLRRTVRFRSPVRLTSVNTIASPVALGLHEICVPEAALTELTADEQRGMLAHELAHLARRDPLWLDLASLMERIFFFQPLNRLARRELQRNAEFLCDDWAAERTGSGLPLAHCLARVADWIEASPLGVPVAGMAEQRSLLVTRIARLIEGRRASLPMSRVLTVAIGTVLLSAIVAAMPGVRGIATPSSRAGEPTTPESMESQIIVGRSVDVITDTTNDNANDATDREQESDTSDDQDDAHDAADVADPTIVAALIERLQDTEASVRAAAATSLGSLGSVTAVPALLAIAGDRSSDVRSAVAEAQGHLGDARAVPTLTRMLSDSSARVREHAAEALGYMSEGNFGTSLLRLLGDPIASVRVAALESLTKHRILIPARDLTTLLADTSAGVRRSALEYAERTPSLAKVTIIRRLLDDGNARVRQQAVEALAGFRSAEARTALREALASPDPAVRREAAEALGERP